MACRLAARSAASSRRDWAAPGEGLFDGATSLERHDDATLSRGRRDEIASRRRVSAGTRASPVDRQFCRGIRQDQGRCTFRPDNRSPAFCGQSRPDQEPSAGPRSRRGLYARAGSPRDARPHLGHASGDPRGSRHQVSRACFQLGDPLVEILRRKLVPVGFSAIRDREQYEQFLVRALASIYAVDVCAGNVVEAKSRLGRRLNCTTPTMVGCSADSRVRLRAVEEVLRTNVLHADMLQDAGTAEVVDYRAEETWRL